MDLEVVENIEKIASKIKHTDRNKRIAMAKEVNELAKLLIDWHGIENEKSNSLHQSLI